MVAVEPYPKELLIPVKRRTIVYTKWRAWSPLKRRMESVSLSGHSVGEGGELGKSFRERSH